MMRYIVIGLGILFVASVFADEKPDDLKKLQGVWLPIRYEMNGKELPKKEWAQTKWEFNNTNVSVTANRVMKTTMEIDPTAKPARIDLQTQNPKVRFICIYRFDGENLIVCCGRETRPGKFETSRHDGFWMITFKREK